MNIECESVPLCAEECSEKDFDSVYMRNIKNVYRICRILLKSADEADDAAQNVFLHYLQKNVKFKDAGHEKAWFITSARNECYNTLKSFRYSRRNSLDDIPEPEYTDSYATDEAEETEILMSLPAKYREILYLYYYEDYSVRAISLLRKCRYY